MEIRGDVGTEHLELYADGDAGVVDERLDAELVERRSALEPEELERLCPSEGMLTGLELMCSDLSLLITSRFCFSKTPRFLNVKEPKSSPTGSLSLRLLELLSRT